MDELCNDISVEKRKAADEQKNSWKTPIVQLHFLSPLQAISAHQLVQSRSADAQYFGGFGNIAAVLLQSLGDDFPFEFFSGLPECSGWDTEAVRSLEFKIRWADGWTFRKNECPFDPVLQLTYVAGPAVPLH